MSSFTFLNLSDVPNAWRQAYNTDIASIQAEFLNTIHKDGSVAMAGTLNMGSYRITEVAAGIDPTDGVQYQQLLDEVDKYTTTNEIVVHPSYTTIVGKRYAKFEQALAYLNGVVYGNKNFKINLKLTDDDDRYTLTGAELALYKEHTHIYADSYNPIEVTLGTSIISGGGNANRGTWNNLVFIFKGVTTTVRLEYLKMYGCIIIVQEAKDLELLGVTARNCVFVLQTGNQIKLITENSSIHLCEGTVDLTEDSANNDGDNIYRISTNIPTFFSYT